MTELENLLVESLKTLSAQHEEQFTQLAKAQAEQSKQLKALAQHVEKLSAQVVQLTEQLAM